MINSFSKILFAAVLLATLPNAAVDAQVQMTRMPTRLEEVLINPDLGAVLRAKVEAKEVAVAPGPPRVASLPVAKPAAPTYSNERSRFSVIKPAINKSKSIASLLPTIEQTEMPPGMASKPVELAFDNEVTAEPIPAISEAPPIAELPIAKFPTAKLPTAIPPSPKVVVAEKTPRLSELKETNEPLKPLAPIKGQLQFRVTGITAMVENQPADVVIEVFNPTGYPIGPVEVNVKVPAELTITRFDKDAWLDAERRIIAFQVDRVNPGAIEKISMKGVSKSAGQTVLDVALLSGETLVAQRSIKTQVFTQQVARKQNFGNEGRDQTIQK